MKKILIDFSIIVLVTIFLIVIIETVCRLTRQPDQGRARAGFVVEDPLLVWRLKPQTEGALATNELGLRDYPYKEDADVKILVLGDSVTWGDGIGDPVQLYTSRLENLLEKRDPQWSYEVINGGVPGYATFQERLYLEEYGLGLKPVRIALFKMADLGSCTPLMVKGARFAHIHFGNHVVAAFLPEASA